MNNSNNDSIHDLFIPADDDHIRREKNAANVLKKSQWWKNVKGRGKCYYCGRRFPPDELTMDHIVPIIRGGRSQKNNVVACCKKCNSEKQNRLPVEWDEYLRGELGDEDS